MSKTFVISVGGSLVVPNGGIDIDFLQQFKKLMLAQVKKDLRFVIVVGGGGTARQYQRAARAIGKLEPDDIDWLGIHSTRLNGHLMRTILREVAHPVMMKDPTAPLKKWTRPVMIAAGWKPGWSTDYVATRFAKRLGAKVVVNLSNVDYLYDKDPNKHTDAKAICEITWKEYRKMVGNTWDPGMNVPFDPVAARLAHHSGISAILVNGKNFPNLSALFQEKPLVGTVIS